MTFEDLQLLGQVYNTLGLISTKNEDTIYMAECLKAIKSLYYKYHEQTNKKEEE